MSRQYYGGVEPIDQHHHPSRSLQLSISQPIRESTRSFPVSRQQNRSSPVPETDTDKSGGTPRKRIGLACARCRKRKIKCSGDQGHGICQNCKSAGMDPSTCLFLRVNSDPVSMNHPSNQMTWNYHHSGLPRTESAVNTYPTMTAPASYPVLPVASSSYPSTIPYTRPQPVASQTTLPYHNNARPTFAQNQGWSTEDLSEAYSLASPHYNLPAQDSQLPAVSYNTPEMSRNWVAISTRQPQQGFHLDQDLSTKYAGTTLPLPSPSLPTSTSGATDLHPQFPVLDTLKTTLPNYPLPHSRILPVPEGKRASISKAHANTSGLMLEEVGMGSLQSLNYRSAETWNPNHTGADVNLHSAGSSTSSTVSGTEGVSSNSSSSPQMSHRNIYRSGQQHRETDYGSNYSAPTPASMKRHAAIDSSSFAGLLSNQDTTSNQYTYNLGPSADKPKGTLVNGQSYTNIQKPHHTQSYEALNNHLASQTSTYPSHRTSISSVRPH